MKTTSQSAESSQPERLVRRNSKDIREFAKSEEAKRQSENIRKRGGPTKEDLDEIPELTDEELAQMRPWKTQLTIRLDTDTLDALRAMPGKYQTRINAVMRRYVELRKRKGNLIVASKETTDIAAGKRS